MLRGVASRLRDSRGLTLAEVVVTLALFGMTAAGVATIWAKTQEAYFAGFESAEVHQNVRAALDFMAREIRSVGLDPTVCAFDYASAAAADCDDAKIARCASKLAGTGPPSWETDNGLGGAGCAGLHAIPFTEATLTTLRIRSDRNRNGRIVGRGNAIDVPAAAADHGEEDVRYALATTSCPPGVPRCITRDDGTGAAAMVAVHISGLTFTYYPRPNFGPCAGASGPCDQPFSLPFTSQAQADGVGRIRIAVEAQRRTAGQVVSRTLVADVTLRNRP